MKQGDPLSCLLFNLVIDWALSALDTDIGYSLLGELVNHLAFADDVVLVASTRVGLQEQISRFTGDLALSGLNVNAAKCSSLSIARDGHTRKFVVDPDLTFTAGGQPMPAMTCVDFYKYLGVHFSAKGSAPMVEGKLQGFLDNLRRAPLKPQQRIWFLRTKVLPAMYHSLVLSHVTKGLLQWLDKMVRAAVRSWTKLPGDTPIAFFHADVKDGGLGIPALQYSIPNLKLNRLQGMASSLDPVVRKIVCSDNFRNRLRKLEGGRNRGGQSPIGSHCHS